MKNDYIIRLETSKDHTQVEHLVRESFWNVYQPGCLEHYVLHCLREDPAFVPELDFVMERDGVIIGQNIFVLTMGPICIAPEVKRQVRKDPFGLRSGAGCEIRCRHCVP